MEEIMQQSEAVNIDEQFEIIHPKDVFLLEEVINLNKTSLDCSDDTFVTCKTSQTDFENFSSSEKVDLIAKFDERDEHEIARSDENEITNIGPEGEENNKKTQKAEETGLYASIDPKEKIKNVNEVIDGFGGTLNKTDDHLSDIVLKEDDISGSKGDEFVDLSTKKKAENINEQFKQDQDVSTIDKEKTPENIDQKLEMNRETEIQQGIEEEKNKHLYPTTKIPTATMTNEDSDSNEDLQKTRKLDWEKRREFQKKRSLQRKSLAEKLDKQENLENDQKKDKQNSVYVSSNEEDTNLHNSATNIQESDCLDKADAKDLPFHSNEDSKEKSEQACETVESSIVGISAQNPQKDSNDEISHHTNENISTVSDSNQLGISRNDNEQLKEDKIDPVNEDLDSKETETSSEISIEGIITYLEDEVEKPVKSLKKLKIDPPETLEKNELSTDSDLVNSLQKLLIDDKPDKIVEADIPTIIIDEISSNEEYTQEKDEKTDFVSQRDILTEDDSIVDIKNMRTEHSDSSKNTEITQSPQTTYEDSINVSKPFERGRKPSRMNVSNKNKDVRQRSQRPESMENLHVPLENTSVTKSRSRSQNTRKRSKSRSRYNKF
ncbi:hypothetical protein EDEG_01636 [Edhazardia aedis USNM 41457]|uniref:Uncharacterized protein n=1 Tax=Edhazardia aedis (strain USNM 41457) TaxID=1003232 RepID=J9DNG0_EDHAE|nr:hypothetical protein EDEG_01636 [Edhazardia aedis USNM 41457]|eukprot:EJW04060.1 hypothetical protein EDEG_01636 [Edhazardia aedis USNM 41457]